MNFLFKGVHYICVKAQRLCFHLGIILRHTRGFLKFISNFKSSQHRFIIFIISAAARWLPVHIFFLRKERKKVRPLSKINRIKEMKQ